MRPDLKIKVKDYKRCRKRYGNVTGSQLAATWGDYETLGNMVALIKSQSNQNILAETFSKAPSSSEESQTIPAIISAQLLWQLEDTKNHEDLPRYYLCFLLVRGVLGYKAFVKHDQVKSVYKQKECVRALFFKQATVDQKRAMDWCVSPEIQAKEHFLYLKDLVESHDQVELARFAQDFSQLSTAVQQQVRRYIESTRLFDTALIYYKSIDPKSDIDGNLRDNAAHILCSLVDALGVDATAYKADPAYQQAMKRAVPKETNLNLCFGLRRR